MSEEIKSKCKMAAYYLSYLANRKSNDYRDTGIEFRDNSALVCVEWMSDEYLHNFVESCRLYGLTWHKSNGKFVLSLPFENVVFKLFRNMTESGIKVENTINFCLPSTIFVDCSIADDYDFHNAMPYPATSSSCGGNFYIHF